MQIRSVGHSSRTLAEFIALMKEYGIRILADIRSYPSSKIHPHFDKNPLEQGLTENGIEYLWLGDLLGGYRKEGYEAYMETESFARGVRRLVELAGRASPAFMCAEKDWSRCHRRWLSDHLVFAGHKVVHILDPGVEVSHRTEPRQLQLDQLLGD